MTMHDAIPVPKKRKTVPRVSAATNNEGSKTTTTKTQATTTSQKKKQKTAKSGIPKNGNKSDDIAKDVITEAVSDESCKSNDASAVCK